MKYKNFYLFFILFILIFQFMYALPEKGDEHKGMMGDEQKGMMGDEQKGMMGDEQKGMGDKHKLGIETEEILNFAKELDLTDEQTARIKEIRDKSRKKIFNLRNEIKTLIWDIQDELKKSNANKNEVDNLIDKISENQKELMKIKIEQFFEVKKILTEEQFKKLTELFEKKKKESKKKCHKSEK